ncbi:MAG: hypothetical protein ABJF23_30930 [Bryobacteraceae bacterium]
MPAISVCFGIFLPKAKPSNCVSRRVEARRFRCRDRDCLRKTLIEQVPPVTVRRGGPAATLTQTNLVYEMVAAKGRQQRVWMAESTPLELEMDDQQIDIDGVRSQRRRKAQHD